MSLFDVVTDLDCSEVGLGFASQFFPLHNMPGWFSPYMSWGYHGDDGDMYGNKAEIHGGHTYGKGDIVGAGVDFSKQEVFFTRNGESLGKWISTRYANFPCYV